MMPPRPSRTPRRLAAVLVAGLPAGWLAWRRRSVRQRIEVQARQRERHDLRLQGLPVYDDSPVTGPDGRPTVSVIVPALNEADSIGWVLAQIPRFVDEVVLVDGLSIDRTEVVARTLVPNLIVVHQRDRGKGAALRAGFHAARGDIVVMIDADGSTDPREIGRFVDALVAGADFVKGSRELPDGGSVDFTSVRRWGNRAFVALANLIYGTRFTDLLYGYCAFWRAHLDDLALSADGFEIETQLVINAVKAGLDIVEVPSRELERRAGASNLNAVRDGLRILETLLLEHPHLGRPIPGETFDLVEIETAAPDLPEWLPAGVDRRKGGDRRNAEIAGGPLPPGAERRAGQDRRRPPVRTVKVLVPRRGPERRQLGPEDGGYRGPERRSGADRRSDAPPDHNPHTGEPPAGD
ncbi:glycosyltransferase family 2 protein [Conexibacter sp. DBS9H8]|uniref:glycosyltransferase family 2 protein n=1 Tax=Conexibacter sp. DBS9H8 TaxID=2937801 RepID=UPI00200C81C2|nr:glycosyltransferase family 2 protein [Conexibacter sp. DBS9H8]